MGDHPPKGRARGLLLGFVVVVLFGLAGLAGSIGLDEGGASGALSYLAACVFLVLGIAAWRDFHGWASGR